MKWAAALALILCTAQVAEAAGPAQSLRPVQRGGNVVTLTPNGALSQPPQNAAQQELKRRPGLLSSLRPLFRSDQVEKEARQRQRMLRRGAVCGDLAIQGKEVGRVHGNLSGCGVTDAVRVSSVSGITLSQRSVMDCGTAKALKSWIEGSAKPALSRRGGGLKSLRVAAHYSCRTRNNRKGAKISEHGKGRAIDISGFILANGTEISVIQGWKSRKYSKALKRMHKGACGPFGTVLGPNADRFHQDHFHFDTARYRSGTYCR